MANDILKTIPTFQSLALLGDNIKSTKSIAKKPTKPIKKMVSQATKNIVGVSLIGATANVIGG